MDQTKAHTCAWQAIAASFGRPFRQDGSEMIGVRWWGGDLFRQLATGGHHSARVGTPAVHYLIIVFQEVHQSDAGFSFHWAFKHQWCHFCLNLWGSICVATSSQTSPAHKSCQDTSPIAVHCGHGMPERVGDPNRSSFHGPMLVERVARCEDFEPFRSPGSSKGATKKALFSK